VTPLPGFEENSYVPFARSDDLSLDQLADEWAAARNASITMFRNLPAEAWVRRGTADGSVISVRALAFIIVGHELHHLETLRTRYGVCERSGCPVRGRPPRKSKWCSPTIRAMDAAPPSHRSRANCRAESHAARYHTPGVRPG